MSKETAAKTAEFFIATDDKCYKADVAVPLTIHTCITALESIGINATSNTLRATTGANFGLYRNEATPKVPITYWELLDWEDQKIVAEFIPVVTGSPTLTTEYIKITAPDGRVIAPHYPCALRDGELRVMEALVRLKDLGEIPHPDSNLTEMAESHELRGFEGGWQLWTKPFNMHCYTFTLCSSDPAAEEPEPPSIEDVALFALVVGRVIGERGLTVDDWADDFAGKVAVECHEAIKASSGIDLDDRTVFLDFVDERAAIFVEKAIAAGLLVHSTTKARKGPFDHIKVGNIVETSNGKAYVITEAPAICHAEEGHISNGRPIHGHARVRMFGNPHDTKTWVYPYTRLREAE